MKKTCFLLLFCLLLSLCACRGGYTEFSDDIYGVSMEYPADWTVSSEDEDLIALFASPDGKDEISLFAENHMIYSLHMTLGEYIDASQEQLTFLDNYQLLATEDRAVGDLRGKFIQYTGSYDDDESKTVYVWTLFVTLKEGYAYVLTHCIEKAHFTDNGVFDAVLNTLEIADNPRYQEELRFYEAYHESLHQGENP